MSTSSTLSSAGSPPNPEALPKDPIIGIDLGTTNSLVAFADQKGPRILSDEPGADGGLVPSVVRYGPSGVEAVGHAAARELRDHPLRTVYSIKRFMGRTLEERRDDLEVVSYPLVEGPRGLASVAFEDRVRTPQEISADVLRHLKERAESSLGVPVRRAVVTVPAYFDDGQRQATRDAGRLAGLDVLRILNEPTAAALAYGLGRRSESENVVVYDLGGGTFDVTVLEVVPPEQDGEESIFQVLATAGDTRLGGDDFDRILVDAQLRHLASEADIDSETRARGRAVLREVGERAKRLLSDVERAEVQVDGAGVIPDCVLDIDRPSFEEAARPLVDRTIAECDRALRDAGLTAADIDRVVLVGGATRMPVVRDAVESWFGRPPYTALDPDRVVALGAAVQGEILAGGRRDALLLDVVPLSLGLETAGGAVAKLVVRNTTIPTQATEMFSTSVDGQVNVALHVLQGEREMSEDCRSLARFELRGLPPMPAGIPQIEVVFKIDANGVLGVDAVERRSGRRAHVQVLPSHGLSESEVDRIERESFEHAREDMLVHRVVDLAVNAALDVKWIREALERVRTELAAELVADVESRLDRLESLVSEARIDPRAVDPDVFHEAKEMLDRASVPVHEAAITRSLRDEGSEPSDPSSPLV